VNFGFDNLYLLIIYCTQTLPLFHHEIFNA